PTIMLVFIGTSVMSSPTLRGPLVPRTCHRVSPWAISSEPGPPSKEEDGRWGRSVNPKTRRSRQLDRVECQDHTRGRFRRVICRTVRELPAPAGLRDPTSGTLLLHPSPLAPIRICFVRFCPSSNRNWRQLWPRTSLSASPSS